MMDPIPPPGRDRTSPPGFCPVHGWSCPARDPPADAPALRLPSPTPAADVDLARWRPLTPAPPGFTTMAARRSTAHSFLTTSVDAPPEAAVPFPALHLLIRSQTAVTDAARPELHLSNGVDPALTSQRPDTSSSSVEEADSIS